MRISVVIRIITNLEHQSYHQQNKNIIKHVDIYFHFKKFKHIPNMVCIKFSLKMNIIKLLIAAANICFYLLDMDVSEINLQYFRRVSRLIIIKMIMYQNV